ncbi:transcriptional regulator [Megalodesulfovibrio paquesii]
MWRFIILALAGFFLYKMFAGDKRQSTKQKKQDIKERVAAGEMVKDPVCGTYVDVDTDIRVRQGETVHRFCSYDCRDKFLRRLEAKEVTPEPVKQAEAKKEEAE